MGEVEKLSNERRLNVSVSFTVNSLITTLFIDLPKLGHHYHRPSLVRFLHINAFD